jgi:hypothetical protein
MPPPGINMPDGATPGGADMTMGDGATPGGWTP